MSKILTYFKAVSTQFAQKCMKLWNREKTNKWQNSHAIEAKCSQKLKLIEF